MGGFEFFFAKSEDSSCCGSKVSPNYKGRVAGQSCGGQLVQTTSFCGLLVALDKNPPRFPEATGFGSSWESLRLFSF